MAMFTLKARPVECPRQDEPRKAVTPQSSARPSVVDAPAVAAVTVNAAPWRLLGVQPAPNRNVWDLNMAVSHVNTGHFKGK